MLLAIGNIYLETNYLNLQTAGCDELIVGKEYRAERFETRFGGSVANFILQAHTLGVDVGLIGKVGTDEQGGKLLSLLHDAGIGTDLIVRSPDVQTSVDTGIVLAHNGQNIMLVSGNANQLLAFKDIDVTSNIFQKTNAVYLGGFLKQESLYKEYPTLLRTLSRRNIQIFLDHGRIPVDMNDDKRNALRESFSFVDVYLPNEEEILGISGSKSLDQAVTTLLSWGPKIITVKRGKKGCLVKTKQERIELPGYSVQAISTVGAGDVFNAGFVTSYLHGESLCDSGIFANAAAAFRVSMNYQGTKSEIERFMKERTAI